MESVEGVVVFRNRMGGTTHIRIETPDKQVKALGFRRAALGDERYDFIGNTAMLRDNT